MFEGNSALGFVLVLAIILLTTKCLGLLFRKAGLPQVLGFIIAGILIGPSIFGELINGGKGFALDGFGEYFCYYYTAENIVKGELLEGDCILRTDGSRAAIYYPMPK